MRRLGKARHAGLFAQIAGAGFYRMTLSTTWITPLLVNTSVATMLLERSALVGMRQAGGCSLPLASGGDGAVHRHLAFHSRTPHGR